MKRIAGFLLALSTLAIQCVNAQSCPSSATYTNQSGTFDLTSGKTIVLNNGKSYQITIQNNFSSTSSICVLNGSTLYLSFVNVNNMGKGGFITVDKNATLNFVGGGVNNFPLSINNNGNVNQQVSFTYIDGATFNNYGNYNITNTATLNSGKVTLNNNGTFYANGALACNSGTFVVTNAANSIITYIGSLLLSNTTVTNSGTINVSGSVGLQNLSAVTNNGYINLGGSFLFSGATFTNNGVFTNGGSIQINSGSIFNNNCTVKCNGSLSTNGTVNNNGNIILSSSFINQGTLTNGNTAQIQGNDFTNNGTVKGSGNFYFYGVTVNQGPFNGISSTNAINFYDASINNGKNNYFDIQNTNPTNTTKNKISPNTATTFTSCDDVTAPVITTQPSTQLLCDNSVTSATFSVTATSNNTLTYQWYKNGTAISGATSSSYTATGLTFADTTAAFTVGVTNGAETKISSPASVKYIIVSQPAPASLYLATGSSATFSIKTSGATGYQWQLAGKNIGGAAATLPTYTNSSIALTDAGNYTATVTYSGGTCTTKAATLTVENLPAITTQPASVVYCTNATTTATFSVANAASTSALTYQWYKNGTAISGATTNTLSLTGLALADTANNYYVILKNGVGTTQSNSASVKYVIYSQPTSLSLVPGSIATFTVGASNIKSYQWQKGTSNIGGATAATYINTSVAVSDSGSYRVQVTYNSTSSYPSGTCTSNPATLSIVGLPTIATQPITQTICNFTTTTATFNVLPVSTTAVTYQWYKNNKAITGATGSSYTATGLTMADTTSTFNVVVSNAYGSITSNNASVKYIILTQPSGLQLATGNAASFSIKTSGATSLIWMKNNLNISGATALSYAIPAVNSADSGSYAALVTYNGGVCTSNAAVLKTSAILYSASKGNLTDPQTWGINTDGSGSNPVNFTRTEHTFVVANQTKAVELNKNFTIAGTLDIAASNFSLGNNATLTVGRIIRSLPGGVLGATNQDSIIINGIGPSDLYFDPNNNTAQRLIINGSTVTLHTVLNITNNNGNKAGSNGVVQVNAGTFYTNDSLVLKSNNLGTASIASSAGTIVGKVTIEKYITNRRSWRLMGAPVSKVNAPTINASYQEGAKSSTDNPHPGYGTHITYGAIADGFDQNPQRTFSMKWYNNGSWVGIPATNKTLVTDYSAFMLFIRGDRSYPILTTTANTKPTSTVLRVTGNVNQGALPAKTIAASGLVLVSNPYACPINFGKVVSASSNLIARIRVWDPSLAGVYGTGGWVTIDGTNGVYRATPPSSLSALLQSGQGFFVQSADGVHTGSMVINESMKDLSSITTTNDRVDSTAAVDTSLEVDLKLFNPDSTTAIADGILFNFNSTFSDSVNNSDAVKMGNVSENLGIKEGNSLLTIDDRTMPAAGDSLHLSLTNAKNASYQFEIVPSSLTNVKFSLYDKYLNSFSPISSSDTTRITFSINTSVAASKAADRFVIVMQKTKISSTVLPVLFTSVKAAAHEKIINVEWKVANETDILYYEVQKSTNAIAFSAAGNVMATGASSYSFTDATPAQGTNYYRIKSVSKTGDVQYTNIVTAQIQTASATGISSVSVYPNPLTGPSFTLTLTNMAAGTYTVAVVNQNGATQFSQSITHSGGTSSQTITLNNSLAAGMYYIKIASATGTTNMVKVEAR